MSVKTKLNLFWKAIAAAVNVVRTQPQVFWSKFKPHMWLLIPLISSQLLQKLQDLVDDRLMNTMGNSALTIHNVQYALYGLAQEIGLIAATSLLIFWKRKETVGNQKTVLLSHFGLTFILSAVVCAVTFIYTDALCEHFSVAPEYLNSAHTYIRVGLGTIMLRSIYVPLNTILIASHQYKKSILAMFSIVSLKIALAYYCGQSLWDHQDNVTSISQPMLTFSLGSIIIVVAVMVYLMRSLFKLADGWGSFNLKYAIRVWPGEIGIGLVSAMSPLLFSFQIAKANTAPGFFVTYQIALHLTYILTLPVLAGAQIATRDASAEQSANKDSPYQPLHKSKWWPKFFYASLMPSVIGLSIAASFPKFIINKLYGYEIPAEHLPFLTPFYCSWIFFQFGTVFLIMLRSFQKNTLATRNIIVSGLCVQLGLTQILLMMNRCSSFAIGMVIACSCFAYLVLNWLSASSLIASKLGLKTSAVILHPGKIGKYTNFPRPEMGVLMMNPSAIREARTLASDLAHNIPGTLPVDLPQDGAPGSAPQNQSTAL